ncbi:uncharacterized protein LOC113516720 isoform X2 [Galleria mellonella]|uniref:Uncharacterized protein LOC113516720 isoform X2 n=1 Tax=Galleria mellonella TaxID=7137 RepID=A0A6J1WP34_GALME|nr:uncharacterized protein LOC113516720 isoform X2 [Galleria mellonella]
MAGVPNDWQLGCVEMKQRGANLLQTGQWSDCTFLVGTEPNQVTIAGHKLILAMASPVFEAMFYGGMAERNDPIPILDVQPDAFKALLEYIYTENINISSFDKACELCYGAKKYMLPHLVKECTTYLWSDLYPKNACRAYEFARLFEENVLMEKCIQIISTNTKEVLKDSSFEEVDLSTVVTLFSLDHLNVDSELDLFEAAVRYAKAQKRNMERNTASPDYGPPSEKRSKSPVPSTSAEKVSDVDKVVNVESSAENSPEAVTESCKSSDTPVSSVSSDIPDDNKKNREVNKDKLTIRNAVEKIRFLTLTPQQFAEGPARSSLLTDSESFAVLMNILSSNCDIPMPQGFSTCRVPRKQLIGGGSTTSREESLAAGCRMQPFSVDTPSPVPLDLVFDVSRPVLPFGGPAAPAVLSGPGLQHYPRPTRHEGPRAGAAGAAEAARLEISKLYCTRAIIQHTDCYNTSVLDCCVTFMVDRNICLLGVQVPTQAPSMESALPLGPSGGASGPGGVGGAGPVGAGASADGYSELLYAHLLDADGARLTYTHYTSRVPYRHLLDIMFNRPVYIQRNKVYKVGIVFNKAGWYPTGICALQVETDGVYFNFGIGQSSDSVRDALIRSIIFTY